MCDQQSLTYADPEGGGTGGPDPPPPPPRENYKNIGFHNNTDSDSLKITKLPIQHSMLGNHRPANETPFKWRFAGGPLMVRLWWYLDPSSPHKTEKKISKLDLPWQNFLDPLMLQINLRIRAVWSEPLVVAWIFYECYVTDWTSFWRFYT